MEADGIAQYIFPILILLFYFFAGGGKKKKKNPPPIKPKEPAAPVRYQVRHQTPPTIKKSSTLPLKKEKSSPPPVQRTLSRFESAIDQRYTTNAIEKRKIDSSISQERADSLVSHELSQHIDIDEAYALKAPPGFSKVKKLFQKKGDLRTAFLLKEILDKHLEIRS